MLERGTEKHDAEAIATLLDKIGAKIDFASDSGTIKFGARCLKKDSAQVIDLLAEQLREPNFPKDEFEKLRKQKIAESQQLKDDPTAQAMIALRRAIFQPGHPEYRLTDDERIAALEKANVDDVKSFHKKNFGAEYCTMVVVGDIEPVAIEKQVKSAFSGWKGGQPLPELPAVKDITKPEDLQVSIPGKESVIVLFGEPTGLHYADPDYLPLSVATNVLGYGFTSRLLATVRDTEGLTYSMQAELMGTGKLDRTWLVYGSFAPSLLKQGLASTHRELAKWYHDGITASELDYRKDSLVGGFRVKLSTSGDLADVILDTVERGLDLNWIDEYPKKVQALTLDQVNSVIQKRLNPNKLVTAEAGTMKSE
jgi:zinc protease